MKNLIKKYYIIFIPLILGFITSSFIDSEINGLNLPNYMPPSYLFSIVWSALYLLMGYSLYLIKDNRNCKIVFTFQFIINLIWPLIFFTKAEFGLAILIIIILILSVLTMLLTFIIQNKKACLINIPYFIWLLIAFYLNCGIYFLN